ncbi:uncharacterized protein [Primulina huaijiensis]|uniref:uncharacterized protein isoform X2 n=1 Tax=Primulina huaijiensis TaxID=1492673 RepID=UPI003CC6F930
MSSMVLKEEVIIATMIEVEGLEGEVLVEGVDEAEALKEGETRVQYGKAVLREGLKLSNGTRKESRKNLSEMTIITLMVVVIDMSVMMRRATITICTHPSKEVKVMTCNVIPAIMRKILEFGCWRTQINASSDVILFYA